MIHMPTLRCSICDKTIRQFDKFLPNGLHVLQRMLLRLLLRLLLLLYGLHVFGKESFCEKCVNDMVQEYDPEGDYIDHTYEVRRDERW